MSPLLAHCPQNSAFVPQDEANASPWGIHVNIGDKYAHLGVQMLNFGDNMPEVGTFCLKLGTCADFRDFMFELGTFCLKLG